MTEPFENAKAAIVSVISGVTGINQAPTNPNETQNIFPFALVYLSTGTLVLGAVGTRKSLYNIAIDVVTNRMNLPDDLAILTPFVDTIPAALEAQVSGAGARFTSTISTFDSITVQFLPEFKYDGVQCIGYRFVMNNVKILSDTGV